MQWNILGVVYYIPLLFLYKVLCPAAKIDPKKISHCWPVLRVFSFLAIGREKLPVIKVRFP